jgi:ATP-dependent protease Clp ATPase subunit
VTRLRSVPKTLVAHIDQFVIGQEVAKRRIALGVSNHFKRVVDTWVADDPIVTDPDLLHVRIEKSNILLIGPSGSGKTHLVRSLASYQRLRSMRSPRTNRWFRGNLLVWLHDQRIRS